MRRLVATIAANAIASSSAATVPPCAPVKADLLRAVLSKLPPNACASADQLQSVMGIWAVDLCGAPLKQLSGSIEGALEAVLGAPLEPDQKRRPNQKPDRPMYRLPAVAPWIDPRAPPLPSTRCLHELIEGSTTWVTNEAGACDELLAEHGFLSAPHVGLDLEWTPTMVRGQRPVVSMLQLATRESCLLLRIEEMSQLGEPLSPRLRELLESHPPLKVGRGINADARLLRPLLGLNVPPAGLMELGGKESLKILARRYASFSMPQADDLSPFHNWQARELSNDSLLYAAFDAIAAADVYTRVGGAAPPRTRERAGGAPGTPELTPIEGQPTSKRRSRRQRARRQLAEMEGLDAPPLVDDSSIGEDSSGGEGAP